MRRFVITFFSFFLLLFGDAKPICNLHNGLILNTYDIRGSSWAYPYSHEQYDEMERRFARSEYRYGSGVVGQINSVGSNNNPFQPDPDERYMSIFEGYIYIPKDGEYGFAVNGDDAVEVIIDNEYVGWYGGHGADGTEHRKLLRLSKGYHKLKFRQQEWSGADNYQLYWKRPWDKSYSIVPKSNLFYCAPPKPIIEYRMDACSWRGSERIVSDSSGNGYDGVAEGGANTTEGILCKGGELKENGYIKSDKAPQLHSYTVSAWIKAPNGNYHPILVKRDRVDNGWGSSDIEIYIGNGFTVVHNRSNGGRFQYVYVEAPPNNRWFHLVVSYDESKKRLRVYYDGELKKEVSNFTPVHNSKSKMFIGRNSSYYLDGEIDELKIFDKALNEREIKQIYKNEKSGRDWDGKERMCAGCKPTCNLHNGLILNTYDIRGSSWAYPYSHEQYDEMERRFARSEYRYGSGVVGQINSVGSNNNPFQPDPDERYMSIFEGYIYIPKDGEYGFAVNGDDAVEVIIDNEYVGWYGGHGADGTEHRKLLRLSKGYHKLKFRQQEWSGADNYQLYWKRPWDKSYSIVPKSNLFYCAQRSEISSYQFDVVDIQRGLNDRNISTKIVGKKFSLKLIALNEDGTKYQEFNGTVCVKIIKNDTTQTALTEWKKLFLQDTNSSIWKDIEIGQAIKNAKVKIAWKRGENSSCPLKSEDNSTLSSDNFAIRPLRFRLELPAIAYAKDKFMFNAFSVDAQKIPVKNYNEKLGDSFAIEAHESKKGCEQGKIDTQSFLFHNGVAQSVEAVYSEIGDINITLREREGKEFAKVDRDDTKEQLRFIAPTSKIVSIKPYKIKVDTIKIKTATTKSWLYMPKSSDISEMNVTVGAKVKAVDKEGSLLRDFNGSCYGKDVEVKFWYKLFNTNKAFPVNVKYMGTTSDANRYLADCNKSILLPKSLFKGGEGYKEYAYAVYSSFFQPLSPIRLQLQKATILDDTLAKIKEAKVVDNNITFYYGYLQTEDLYTSKTNDSTQARVVVYDKTDSLYTRGWREFIINWYLMESDEITHINIAKITEDFDYKSRIVNDINANVSSIKGGRFAITIANPKKYSQAFLHMSIPSWLWYNPDKRAYFAKEGDCAHHPCIHYRYFSEQSSDVKSGEVSGVKFEQNISKHRRGVKIFR